jgi:acetyltransferase-like isoleucine patch superfamily enzyme
MSRIRVIIRQFMNFWNECNSLSYVLNKFPSTTIEPRVTFKGDLENLKLGLNVQIQSGSILHLGGMDWCNNSGTISIGDDSIISPNCVIYGCGPGGVHIGSRFECGPNVSIFASQSDFFARRSDLSKGLNHHIFEPVHIGDDVSVCTNVVINRGVTIGSGTVIAAGSVVTRDVPENSFIGGSPAKLIRQMR